MAAKSIIQVDVDDAAFQRFNELFQKYQKQVKELPAAWGKTGEKIDESASSFADMTAALMAQKQLLADQAKEAEKQAKAEKEAADQKRKADQEAAKASKKRHDDFKKITKEAEKTAKWVGMATLDLLKWVTLGGIGLGVGALAGLSGLAAGVAEQRRAALGYGVTSGQMRALNITYGRYFDANSMLENIANAQNDVTQRWAFSAIGINPTGKNAAELAVQMAPRAKQLFEQGGMTQQSAQAHGLLQFYTMDELRRLHAMSMKDLQASERQYQGAVGPLSLTEQAQRKWQAFSTSLDLAGAKIKNTLVDGLTPLAGPLNGLTDAFSKALMTFLKSDKLKQWMDDLGQGLQKFAAYVTSDKFQSDVKTFVDDFAYLAEQIVRGLRFLHLIPADTTAGGLPATPGAASGGGFNTGGAYEHRAIKALGKFFVSQGWTKQQSAGIVANLMDESRINPFAVGDRGAAYGIAQWHADRQKEYQKLFGHTMQSVKDPQQALAEQMRFVNYELTQGKEKAAGNELRNQLWANRSAEAMSLYYERPAGGAREAEKRGRDAQVVINIMNQTGAAVSVQSSQLPQ